jgi:voltage-gated potassium channel
MKAQPLPNVPPLPPWQHKLHTIVFEADTTAGKLFDIVVITLIVLSVAVVMLESDSSIRSRYGPVLNSLEWIFTILFTIEYILRLISIGKPARYAFSFFGIVDLLSVLPTYLSLIIPGSHYLLNIRILRLLRIFRVFKLTEYVIEGGVITQALKASRRKIAVFFFAVLTIIVIVGTLMYVVEGEEHGFTSIPTSIYWAIVTMTTVGYGDLSPQSTLGRFVASLVMILGYSILAVPTGIVSVEFSRASKQSVTTQACPQCSAQGHDVDAVYCKYCSSKL